MAEVSGHHRTSVEAMLLDAAARHGELVARLPAPLAASLPVDGQGLQRVIEYLAIAVGLPAEERRALVRPHGVNAAVMHARVFGGARRLTPETVTAAFVDGAAVRAGALQALADAADATGPLAREVRALLLEHPPPNPGAGTTALDDLRAVYGAQERAALRIAEALDEPRDAGADG